MAVFKKRSVSDARVAAVTAATAAVPIVGDPRMAPPTPDLGSSQDSAPAPANGNEFVVGRVYDIPLKRIRSNPFNPRAIYPASAVEEMALSLSAYGQRISATGFVDGDGDVVLIEGETRLRGAASAGIATLRVEIKERPANDQALYEEARGANVGRRDQTPLDDALKWKELLSKNVYSSQAAIARALGMGEDHVSRVLALAELPRRLTDTLADIPELLNLKMLNALREFWKLRGDDDTLELILEVARAGLGYREVVARRKAAERGPAKRPRSIREVVEFKGARGELKSFENEGRVELSIKGLSAEAAEELSQKLKSLLSA